MNEQTVKLIEQLAAKLGTTAEHLWGVLIRQAPITATTDLLVFIAACVGLVLAVRLFARVIRRFDSGDEELRDVLLGVIGAIIGLICLIIIVANMLYMGTTLSGFFNPEYWALRQILP